MRLFIAIEIPNDMRNYLGKIQEKIDDVTNKIRFVDKNNIHLTLKFLGEVQPDKTEEVKEILKKITFSPFSVHLDGIGVFPSESYIRVVWIGLKPEDKILELQKDIDEKLKKLFKKEKNFEAHVTLARVKFVENTENFINKLKNIKIENKKIEVSNFKLVKSALTPIGPIYEDLEVFGS